MQVLIQQLWVEPTILHFQQASQCCQSSYFASSALNTEVLLDHSLFCSRGWLLWTWHALPPPCATKYIWKWHNPVFKSEYCKCGENPQWVGCFFFFLISFLSGAMNKERPNYLCIQSVLQWFVNSQLWLMRLYWIKWLFSTSYCSVLACVCLCFHWTSIISRHFCQYYKMGWSFFVFYGVGLSS